MDSLDDSRQGSGRDESDRNAQFLALYSEHYPRLHYFLLALLPTSSDAADVLQETSLVLWQKFESFEIGTNFFAWACKIARLQALKHYERARRPDGVFRAATIDKLADDVVADAARPLPLLEILESCVAVLNDSDRILIRRRYEPGACVNRIAEEIGLSANLLSKSLGRIRRLLMDCMQRKLADES
jgi:RNA polymerase sigma-70 factor, ECF subfamily